MTTYILHVQYKDDDVGICMVLGSDCMHFTCTIHVYYSDYSTSTMYIQVVTVLDLYMHIILVYCTCSPLISSRLLYGNYEPVMSHIWC